MGWPGWKHNRVLNPGEMLSNQQEKGLKGCQGISSSQGRGNVLGWQEHLQVAYGYWFAVLQLACFPGISA